MSQKVFLIRHCQAEGQEPTAPLTQKGRGDALNLVELLSGQKIGAIYSSPYARAVQTATPIANALNLTIQTDKRLQERVLSTENLPDWLERLKLTFEDMSLKYLGGESSEEAMCRAFNAIDDILYSQVQSVVVVTHGNLLSLILHHYDKTYGFEAWKSLSNPDVFRLAFENNIVKIDRVWA